MTFRSAIFAKSVRISSCTPSVKYALSGSRLRFSNGSTAIDFALMIDFDSLGMALDTSAASRLGVSTNLSNAKYPTAKSSTTMIMRSIRRPVCGVIDCSGATSSSRFRPCGVSSKTQLKITAGTNPIANKTTTVRGSHSGAPNIGSTVPATCTTSHAPTR
jgi:hypothetical protein